MKTLATSIMLSALLFGTPVLAGSGHDHGHSHAPVTQEVAKTNATKIVATLVKKTIVDKSWAMITAASVEKKEINGRSEWLVIFINEDIEDAEKKKLYVFLSLGGDYIAANYTGK